MRVVVLGVGGFVGGAVFRKLREAGDTVVGLARRLDAAAAADMEAEPLKLADPGSLALAFRNADAVVHAAGVASPRVARATLRETHIAGTEHVVAAAKHAGVRHLVLVSCADVTLCDRDRLHFNEKRDSEAGPMDAHGESKRLAEEIALTHDSGTVASRSEFRVTALRPSWVWGAGDRGAAWRHLGWGPQQGISLVGAGVNLLCTVHVDNLADAVGQVLRAKDVGGRAYYVADGHFLEAREFLREWSTAMGFSPPKRGAPMAWMRAQASWRERLGKSGPWRRDVAKLGRGTFFDASQLRHGVGWNPQMSLEKGMRELQEWVKSTR